MLSNGLLCGLYELINQIWTKLLKQGIYALIDKTEVREWYDEFGVQIFIISTSSHFVICNLFWLNFFTWLSFGMWKTHFGSIDEWNLYLVAARMLFVTNNIFWMTIKCEWMFAQYYVRLAITSHKSARLNVIVWISFLPCAKYVFFSLLFLWFSSQIDLDIFGSNWKLNKKFFLLCMCDFFETIERN